MKSSSEDNKDPMLKAIIPFIVLGVALLFISQETVSLSLNISHVSNILGMVMLAIPIIVLIAREVLLRHHGKNGANEKRDR